MRYIVLIIGAAVVFCAGFFVAPKVSAAVIPGVAAVVATVPDRDGPFVVYSDLKAYSFDACPNAPALATQAKWIVSSPMGRSVTVNELWVRVLPKHRSDLYRWYLYSGSNAMDGSAALCYPSDSAHWRRIPLPAERSFDWAYEDAAQLRVNAILAYHNPGATADCRNVSVDYILQRDDLKCTHQRGSPSIAEAEGSVSIRYSHRCNMPPAIASATAMTERLSLERWNGINAWVEVVGGSTEKELNAKAVDFMHRHYVANEPGRYRAKMVTLIQGTTSQALYGDVAGCQLHEQHIVRCQWVSKHYQVNK